MQVVRNVEVAKGLVTPRTKSHGISKLNFIQADPVLRKFSDAGAVEHHLAPEVLRKRPGPADLSATRVALVGNRSVVFDWSDKITDDVYAVDDLLALCDAVVQLPCRGVKNSLNVGVALGMCGHEILRQWLVRGDVEPPRPRHTSPARWSRPPTTTRPLVRRRQRSRFAFAAAAGPDLREVESAERRGAPPPAPPPPPPPHPPPPQNSPDRPSEPPGRRPGR